MVNFFFFLNDLDWLFSILSFGFMNNGNCGLSCSDYWVRSCCFALFKTCSTASIFSGENDGSLKELGLVFDRLVELVILRTSFIRSTSLWSSLSDLYEVTRLDEFECISELANFKFYSLSMICKPRLNSMFLRVILHFRIDSRPCVDFRLGDVPGPLTNSFFWTVILLVLQRLIII